MIFCVALLGNFYALWNRVFQILHQVILTEKKHEWLLFGEYSVWILARKLAKVFFLVTATSSSTASSNRPLTASCQTSVYQNSCLHSHFILNHITFVVYLVLLNKQLILCQRSEWHICSETLVIIYKITWHHNLENYSPQPISQSWIKYFA